MIDEAFIIGPDIDIEELVGDFLYLTIAYLEGSDPENLSHD